MKRPKGKPLRPRRQWQINPVTRVKESAKQYARRTAKENLRKRLEDEA
jgi:hypothetical protein